MLGARRVCSELHGPKLIMRVGARVLARETTQCSPVLAHALAPQLSDERARSARQLDTRQLAWRAMNKLR